LYQSPKYTLVGDRALLVEFGNSINPEVNRRVHALDRALRQARQRGVEECVPTYRSLLVYYDPSQTSPEKLIYYLKDLEATLGDASVSGQERVIDVPVVYGGEYGPDLGHVAQYHGLTEDDVVRLHCSRRYTVYMVGFLAGFPYLGEVASEIATPRLRTPRLRVPAGSVGIAEKQTGIYPCASPGGWQIIGRTPLTIFDVEKQPPALILPGATVMFKPVTETDFDNLPRNG
jgi:inhibitor of KinA